MFYGFYTEFFFLFCSLLVVIGSFFFFSEALVLRDKSTEKT